MTRNMHGIACSGVLAGMLSAALAAGAAVDPAGTVADPIIDSRMSADEAFDGLDRRCPKDLRERQAIVSVLYWGFDNKVHRGQIILDKDLEKDIAAVFEIALKEKFPIQSVIPVSLPKFRKNGAWSDDLSMAANNTSSFNYREVTGGTSLSKHALGRAVDINPVQNPYIKGRPLSRRARNTTPRFPARSPRTIRSRRPFSPAAGTGAGTGNRSRTISISKSQPRTPSE